MRDLSFLQMIKRDVSHIYVYLQSTLSKTIPKETFWRMGVLISLIPSSKCHSNTLMRYKKLYQDKYQMQILTIIFAFVGKLDQLVVKVHSCIFMLEINKYALSNVFQPQNHFIDNMYTSLIKQYIETAFALFLRYNVYCKKDIPQQIDIFIYLKFDL